MEALSVIEMCFKSWGKTSEGEDIWESMFPNSDDPKAELIFTWRPSLGQASRFHQSPLLKNADRRGERDFA
jgi:hypothetical protein